MIIRIKKRTVKQAVFVFFSLLITLTIISGVSFTTESVFAGNVTNYTVIAIVNVSNTEPNLYKVVIDHPLDSEGNIDV